MCVCRVATGQVFMSHATQSFQDSPGERPLWIEYLSFFFFFKLSWFPTSHQWRAHLGCPTVETERGHDGIWKGRVLRAYINWSLGCCVFQHFGPTFFFWDTLGGPMDTACNSMARKQLPFEFTFCPSDCQKVASVWDYYVFNISQDMLTFLS